MLVGRVDEVSEPVVDKLLGQCTSLHIRVHIYFCHLEALVLQHRLYRDDVRMNLTPAQWLDGCIDDICTVVTNLEDRCHRESGTRVSVILDDNLRVLCLDGLCKGSQHCGLSDTGHILQADLLCTCSNHLIGNLRVVLYSVNRTGGDT